MSIQWIFFDIGSTLVDETEAYNHRIRDMLESTDITFETFDNKRIELAKAGVDGNSEAIKYFNLKKTPWHSEDEIPYPDSYKTLSFLKKQYKLGIIANQNAGLKQRLSSWNLLKFFDVIVSSSEVGVSKPNKGIFEKALELSMCFPQNAVMVGDRLDNDILPAKEIGMKTVWLRKGLAAYQNKEYGKSAANWIIKELAELPLIFA